MKNSIQAVLTATKIGFDAKASNKLTAAQISASWDYKKEGLKISEARSIIADFAKSANEKATKEFNSRVEKALQISTYSNYSYGRYDFPIRDFKVSKNCIATIAWDESHDWNYYAKSYGKPKSEYTDRRVTFRTFDAILGTTETKTFDLASFAGQFLEKALVWFFESQPVKVAKELKSLQLNPIFAVSPLRSIGGISVYSRSISGCIWDYCVVSKGVTFHAETIEKAIAGLRSKAEKAAKMELQRIESESRLITYDMCCESVKGNIYGFCGTGIRNFCDLNNLDIEKGYTIKEIRAAVLESKDANCARFSGELKTLGIVLNCK